MMFGVGPEVFLSEGPAGTGFQVSLEGSSFVVIEERVVGDDLLGARLRGMGRVSGVVVGEPLVEVSGEADVALFWRRKALEQVDVGHGGSPGPLKRVSSLRESLPASGKAATRGAKGHVR